MTEHGPIFADEALNNTKTTSDFIPEGSPFDEAQRAYLNGLFSGIHAIAKGSTTIEQTPLKVYFGSQTGTAEALSRELRKQSATKGFKADLADLNSIMPEDLASTKHVLFIAATCGEGDPADNAANFMDALLSDDCPPLPESLNYSVLGLGDSSYAQFNQAAKDLDARLAELGATRAADLVACDLDYEDDFALWCDTVFTTDAFLSAAGGAILAEAEAPKAVFDRSHPFLGTLMQAICLSGETSSKRVNHIEISLCGGGADLDYEVGDALGVWPLNDIAEVEAILAASGHTGSEIVALKAGPSTLRQALFTVLDLTTLTAKTAESWGCEMQEGDHVLDALVRTRDLTAQALTDGLRGLQPRLYSISSSPKKHPGEVHLTIGEVQYTHNGRDGKGVASNYLGGRLQRGGAVGVYVHKAHHFKLPNDDGVPVIMIGPGTGIAPFRAFLEEREARQAKGENWLFFGDQHQASDYLYQDAIETWHEGGLLTKLSLAWSRDSDRKCYVQHLIKQSGATFYDWLERGAVIYVCGDALRMAADVDVVIHDIVAEHSGLDANGAIAYVAGLRQANRYQRDVY
ncbi:flavodoxin domain-containing protein [uncultured Tateyamaria sp.]|uniref:diflavin oxidoreductase n=1 Tax=uncultured Tateyamaria sp. TaxID=455651 RepID=UPI00260FBFC0|nr:flavodoxin domain-containing protein [uncultured Tateyamaria sp.]